MALDIMDAIYANLGPNVDPIDAVFSYATDYRVLAFFASHNANSWKAATNATLTVPAGKKFVALGVFFGPYETDINRDARLWNATSGSQVLGKSDTKSSTFPWTGDLTTPSKFIEVASGSTIRLEIWNTDTNKRAMGIMVIGRLDDDGSVTPGSHMRYIPVL